MIGITAASGQLGRLVLDELLRRVPAQDIVATTRNVASLADYAAKGVDVRRADYAAPDTLGPAFAGIDRLLLISGNAVGQRFEQHQAAIQAAIDAGVGFLAYTSVIHADRATNPLAVEHRQTEGALRESGLAYTILRHGWYLDGYVNFVKDALQLGRLNGSSGDGRISAASRADLAVADAIVVIGGKEHAGRTYELGGDVTFTLTDFAADIAKASGQPITYNNMSEADFAAALEGLGWPPYIAAMIATSGVHSAGDTLFDDSGTLRRLIGRSTITPLQAITKALPASA